MDLNKLTPEEIVFLYLRHKRYMQVHEDVKESIKELNKEGVETQPTLGDLDNNEHIVMLQILNEKLEGTYNIIAETLPYIVEDITKIVENPMNLPEADEFESESDNDDLF